MRFWIFLTFVVFLFACQPQKVVKVPSQLMVTETSEKPIRGRIFIGDLKVPFRCHPKGDKFIFPLTFVGFIGYSGHTLRVGKYEFSFPLGLCKILNRRLVFPNYNVEKTPEGYLIKSSKGEVFSEVYTDLLWRVKEAQICDPSGCYEIKYSRNWVEIEGWGWSLTFEVNPFPPKTSGYRPRYTPLKL